MRTKKIRIAIVIMSFFYINNIAVAQNIGSTPYTTGKLGVGIQIPNRNLHVYNPSGNGEMILASKLTTNTGDYSRLVFNVGGSASIDDYAYRGRLAYIQAVSTKGWGQNVRLELCTSPSYRDRPLPRLIVSHKGDVGIGTTTPIDKLQVNGVEKRIVFGEATSGSNVSIKSYIGFNLNHDKRPGHDNFDVLTSWSGSNAIVHTSGGRMKFVSTPAGVTNISRENLYNKYCVMTLYTNPSGQKGVAVIGSGDNNANLYVNGTMKAYEIEVKILNWSDFVFDNDYKLRSLKEVEDYILLNKHLPDVPSEEEVKEDGVSLGEMDALLLQKIEELTLYVIEQNKKIKVLEEQIFKK